jgi:rubrerythrin
MKKRTKPASTSEPAESGTAAVVSVTPPVLEAVTLANLQTAFDGETNAHARYRAFAQEADEEGYAPVASKFRAAARAEEIHARNHAEAIRSLGVEPKAKLEATVVRSAHDNLETAIRGEIYGRDEMYPAFLHNARLERIQPAARTFHLAQKAETEHAALFTQALRDLERLRGGAIVSYVCPVCGLISAKADGPRCPVCSVSTDRFERVS